MRLRLLFLACMLASPANALTFQTRLERAQWQVEGDQFECRLTQPVAGFGVGEFVRRAGEQPIFRLQSPDRWLSNGSATLLAAAALGYGRCLSRLLAHGASATVLNRFSSTALMSASERGHADICRQLLEETDVDVNHQNTLGWTALIEAVLLGDGGVDYQRVVEQLMAHGADVNLADAEGVTPLAHARWRKFDALSAMLEAAGGHEQGVAQDISRDDLARTSTPRRA